MDCSDYIPYGPKWEAEMMRMRKIDLVDMVRRAMIKKENGLSHNSAMFILPCSGMDINVDRCPAVARALKSDCLKI